MNDVMWEPFLGAMGDRYGSHTFQIEAPRNDTLTALLAHRSVRAYLPDPLPFSDRL